MGSTIFLVFTIYLACFKSVAADMITARYKGTYDQSKRIKFRSAVWKCMYGLSSVLLGIIVFSRRKYITGNMQKFFTSSTASSTMRLYTIFSLSFYFIEIVTAYNEPPKSDRTQMVLHHFVTSTLLIVGPFYDYTNHAVFILLLHDISDPLMEGAKIALYLGYQKTANGLFCLFAVIFMLMRLVFYPIWVSGFIYYEAFSKLWPTHIVIVVICLVLLQIMHVIWSALIIIMATSFLRGRKIRDIRSRNE